MKPRMSIGRCCCGGGVIPPVGERISAFNFPVEFYQQFPSSLGTQTIKRDPLTSASTEWSHNVGLTEMVKRSTDDTFPGEYQDSAIYFEFTPTAKPVQSAMLSFATEPLYKNDSSSPIWGTDGFYDEVPSSNGQVQGAYTRDDIIFGISWASLVGTSIVTWPFPWPYGQGVTIDVWDLVKAAVNDPAYVVGDKVGIVLQRLMVFVDEYPLNSITISDPAGPIPQGPAVAIGATPFIDLV